MLTFISEEKFPLKDQRIVYGDMAMRFCKNIKQKDVAFSRDERYALILYSRSNGLGRAEAGIIYGCGPEFQVSDLFGIKMLRLFSWDRRVCLAVAKEYYRSLMRKGLFFYPEAR